MDEQKSPRTRNTVSRYRPDLGRPRRYPARIVSHVLLAELYRRLGILGYGFHTVCLALDAGRLALDATITGDTNFVHVD